MRRRIYRQGMKRRLSKEQRKSLLRPASLQPVEAEILLQTLASQMPHQGLPEKSFQSLVIDAARLFGWLTFHPFDSRRSTPGWPDLAMAREGQFLVAELKTCKGRTSPEQEVWLELLRSAGIPTYLWRPADWAEIVHVLAGKEPT